MNEGMYLRKNQKEERLPEPAENPGIVETEIMEIKVDVKKEDEILQGIKKLLEILKLSYSLLEIINLIIKLLKAEKEK